MLGDTALVGEAHDNTGFATGHASLSFLAGERERIGFGGERCERERIGFKRQRDARERIISMFYEAGGFF